MHVVIVKMISHINFLQQVMYHCVWSYFSNIGNHSFVYMRPIYRHLILIYDYTNRGRQLDVRLTLTFPLHPTIQCVPKKGWSPRY